MTFPQNCPALFALFGLVACGSASDLPTSTHEAPAPAQPKSGSVEHPRSENPLAGKPTCDQVAGSTALDAISPASALRFHPLTLRISGTNLAQAAGETVELIMETEGIPPWFAGDQPHPVRMNATAISVCELELPITFLWKGSHRFRVANQGASDLRGAIVQVDDDAFGGKGRNGCIDEARSDSIAALHVSELAGSCWSDEILWPGGASGSSDIISLDTVMARMHTECGYRCQEDAACSRFFARLRECEIAGTSD